MEKLLGLIMAGLPLIFAFGFLVPVIMQGMAAMEWQPPFGLSTFNFALFLGGSLGLLAQVRGRWI